MQQSSGSTPIHYTLFLLFMLLPCRHVAVQTLQHGARRHAQQPTGSLKGLVVAVQSSQRRGANIATSRCKHRNVAVRTSQHGARRRAQQPTGSRNELVASLQTSQHSARRHAQQPTGSLKGLVVAVQTSQQQRYTSRTTTNQIAQQPIPPLRIVMVTYLC
jgi:hypothetical protein